MDGGCAGRGGTTPLRLWTEIKRGCEDMSEAVKTYEGWYAYHDLRKIDWSRWKSLAPEKREETVQELLEALREFASVEEQRTGSRGQYAVLRHKADLLCIHFRPTLQAWNEVRCRSDRT